MAKLGVRVRPRPVPVARRPSPLAPPSGAGPNEFADPTGGNAFGLQNQIDAAANRQDEAFLAGLRPQLEVFSSFLRALGDAVTGYVAAVAGTQVPRVPFNPPSVDVPFAEGELPTMAGGAHRFTITGQPIFAGRQATLRLAGGEQRPFGFDATAYEYRPSGGGDVEEFVVHAGQPVFAAFVDLAGRSQVELSAGPFGGVLIPKREPPDGDPNEDDALIVTIPDPRNPRTRRRGEGGPFAQSYLIVLDLSGGVEPPGPDFDPRAALPSVIPPVVTSITTVTNPEPADIEFHFETNHGDIVDRDGFIRRSTGITRLSAGINGARPSVGAGTLVRGNEPLNVPSEAFINAIYGAGTPGAIAALEARTLALRDVPDSLMYVVKPLTSVSFLNWRGGDVWEDALVNHLPRLFIEIYSPRPVNDVSAWFRDPVDIERAGMDDVTYDGLASLGLVLGHRIDGITAARLAELGLEEGGVAEKFEWSTLERWGPAFADTTTANVLWGHLYMRNFARRISTRQPINTLMQDGARARPANVLSFYPEDPSQHAYHARMGAEWSEGTLVARIGSAPVMPFWARDVVSHNDNRMVGAPMFTEGSKFTSIWERSTIRRELNDTFYTGQSSRMTAAWYQARSGTLPQTATLDRTPPFERGWPGIAYPKASATSVLSSLINERGGSTLSSAERKSVYWYMDVPATPTTPAKLVQYVGNARWNVSMTRKARYIARLSNGHYQAREAPEVKGTFSVVVPDNTIVSGPPTSISTILGVRVTAEVRIRLPADSEGPARDGWSDEAVYQVGVAEEPDTELAVPSVLVVDDTWDEFIRQARKIRALASAPLLVGGYPSLFGLQYLHHVRVKRITAAVKVGRDTTQHVLLSTPTELNIPVSGAPQAFDASNITKPMSHLHIIAACVQRNAREAALVHARFETPIRPPDGGSGLLGQRQAVFESVDVVDVNVTTARFFLAATTP